MQLFSSNPGFQITYVKDILSVSWCPILCAKNQELQKSLPSSRVSTKVDKIHMEVAADIYSWSRR